MLHGGRLKNKDVRNDSYFGALTKDLADDDEVLFIGFARRDEADRKKIFERECGFLFAQTSKKVKAVYATHNELIRQIQRAKTIHITGGESPELVRDLRQYPDFLSSLRGKLVAGSSAGACLFSTKYYYGEQRRVLEGLGTFPIALMVHYGSLEPEFDATDETLQLLKSQAGKLEVVALEEGEWITREAEL